MEATYCGNDSMEESWWYRVREFEEKSTSEREKEKGGEKDERR